MFGNFWFGVNDSVVVIEYVVVSSTPVGGRGLGADRETQAFRMVFTMGSCGSPKLVSSIFVIFRKIHPPQSTITVLVCLIYRITNAGLQLFNLQTTLCEAKMPVATILVHTKNVYDFVCDVKMQFSGMLFFTLKT